jgi:hypothetical protein
MAWLPWVYKNKIIAGFLMFQATLAGRVPARINENNLFLLF